MPLRAAAASVTPLDGPVEVVADSESQDSRREGVELAAEGSALRRWAARRACDLEEFGVLDDPRTDEGHPPPPTHVEVFCSTLVIESVIGAVISMGWLLGGRWPPAGAEGSTLGSNTLCNFFTWVGLAPLSTFFASYDYELITWGWFAYYMSCMSTGMLFVRTAVEQLSGARKSWLIVYVTIQGGYAAIFLPFVQVRRA